MLLGSRATSSKFFLKSSLAIPRHPIPTLHSIGWVTCLEATKAGSRTGRVLATNIFQREGSGWKLVHHHGSII